MNFTSENIRNRKLRPVFHPHKIHLEFSTYQQKFKWILCTENLVLIAVFQDVKIIRFKKDDKYVFKG